MSSTIAEWIQGWLSSYLADRQSGAPRAIDVSERFSRMGLDSLGATKLAAELGEALGRVLPATVVWEYPTVEALSRYLTEGAADRAVSRRAAPAPGYEPIAVVGMACRFPKAPSPEAFWRLLRDGVDAITTVPRERWDVDALYDPDPAAPGKMSARQAGFLDQVDRFDPMFFGISPREAEQMDPQQRLMLELSWEALEDAGVPPHGLRDSLTGVFFGALWHDYARLLGRDLDAIVQHTATGQDVSVIPARVSYTLGLQGPSIAVNTACSSSLVAVHLACESLRAGDATLALAGGVNLIIAPDTMVALSKFGGLSPDGRSKAFDAGADGYGRGEGGGVLVLKRLSRAIADGDRIHGLIRATVVNNDGFSNGLTAPNPRAQEDILREAYRRAGVPGHRVYYVEAHGTGTALGDPIEARALGVILGEGRRPERPLRIGSVKTNIGHLEGAAGIAGLMKTILAVKHREIPPSLHFEQPNPHIPFEELRLQVARGLEPWPAPDEPALAGVSSFGWGGTNAHAVVEGWAPAVPASVMLSAESASSLEALARDLRASASQKSLPELLLEAREKGGGRSLPHRLAVAAQTAGELSEKLDSFLQGKQAPGLASGVTPGRRRKVAFICSPQGAQWLGMGRKLMSSEPVFRAALERVGRELSQHTGWSLIDELLADEASARFGDVDFVQPAIFALQIALAEQWRAWGVEPDAVVGVCIGEVGAAYIAGILGLKDAVRVAYHFSRLQRRMADQGGMAVVGLAAEELQGALERYAGRVCIAGYSSGDSTVISGDRAALGELISALKDRGVLCGMVRINVAVHSPQMDAITGELEQALSEIQPRRASIPMISALSGGVLVGPEACGAHYAHCLRQPMYFARAAELLLAEGYDTFVELSSHPALLDALRADARRSGNAVEALPSLSREGDERVTMFESRGRLYTLGVGTEPEPWVGSEREDRPVPAEVFVLSARSPEALQERAQATSSWVAEPLGASLRDLCYTSSVRRSHHEHRLAAVASSRRELSEVLAAFARGDASAHVVHGEAAPGAPPKLVFVFSGQGSQRIGMGRELLAEEPTFRAVMEECDSLVRRHGGFSLLDELMAPESESRLGDTAVAQPALFAVQVALAALWRSWGIRPDAVLGQSIGEIAAAHVAGILSLDDAIRIVCLRGRILRSAAGKGRMATVELSPEEASEALTSHGGRLAIASINSPSSVVLAGETSALEDLVERLEQRDVYCRWLAVDYASHSPLMEPLRREIEDAIGTLDLRSPELPMYSTVTGAKLKDTELGAAYWARNLCETVLLAPAVEASIGDGHRLLLDVSPHPVLLGSLQQCIAKHDACHAIPTLRRGQGERRCLMLSIGALYAHGYPVPWELLHPSGGRSVSLPTYPWQRQRYWLDDRVRAAAQVRRARLAPGEATDRALLGASLASSVQPGTQFWEQALSVEALPWLGHHCVLGDPVLPGAAYVDMALSAAIEVGGEELPALTGVAFERMLSAPSQGGRIVQVVLAETASGEASFQVSSRAEGDQDWVRHAVGRLRWRAPIAAPERPGETPDAIAERCPAAVSGAEHHRRMAEIGLDYGPSFQSIQHLWLGPGEVLGRVRLPDEAIAFRGRHEVHPALLDGCFQALVALFTAEQGERTGSSPWVPVGFDAVRVHRRPGREVWVHGRASAGAESVGDLMLLDEDGEILAEVRGLRLRKLPASAAARPSPGEAWLVGLEWRRREPLPDIPAELHARPPGAYLLLTDRGGTGAALAELLRRRGDACVRCVAGERFRCIEPGLFEVDPADPSAYRALLREAFGPGQACRGVVHLFGLDATAAGETTPETLDQDQRLGSLSALLLAQALLQQGWRYTPKLWLVTRGVQAVGAEAGPISISQAPLWGIGRTLALEHPELECVRIDLSPWREAEEDASALLRELGAKDGEDQVALRPDGRHVARLARASSSASCEPSPVLQPAGNRPFRLELSEPGTLERLSLRESGRRPPGPGEVEIEVEHAALNFLDVLLALGMIPHEEGGAAPLRARVGLECSGRIAAVGEGVTEFREGDAVLAVGSDCFSSYLTTRSGWVARIPPDLGSVEAAAVPIAFMTAHHALTDAGRLRAGERVLIHAGSGGVGMAAIQIAQHVGAEIFATAGSEEKRSLLRSLGVPHVLDSRSTQFADDVMRITNGEGVDVVLNSLSGELIGASLGVLRDYGRFVEIGKRDYYENRQLALRPFLKSLSFSLVDLRAMMRLRPDLIASLLKDVVRLLDQRALRPVPCQAFPVAKVAEAFDAMARAKHVGKLVVAMQDRDARIAPASHAGGDGLRAGGTYLITGGLGGLGLSVAQWMVSQGARHLTLLGRSGVSVETASAVAAMEAAGAEVRVVRADVSRHGEIDAALTSIRRGMPPLRGVVHAAAVLDDRTTLEMSADQLRKVMAPKMLGAWNLHALTREDSLDFFVLYSSAVSLLGSPGQANYVAANVFLDALAHHRRGLGLPAMSIAWGPFSEVGLAAAQENRGARLASRGMQSLTPAEGTEVLGRLLAQPRPQVGVVPLDVRQWLEFYPSAGSSPFLTEMLQDDSSAAAQSTARTFRKALALARPHERVALLEAELRQQAGKVLGLPASRIDPLSGFTSLGMDSLMSLELRNRLEFSLELKLSASLLFMYPNLKSLMRYLSAELALSAVSDTAPAPSRGGATKGETSRSVESLGEDELMALFDGPTD